MNRLVSLLMLCFVSPVLAWTFNQPIDRRNAFSSIVSGPVSGAILLSNVPPAAAADSTLALETFQDASTGVKLNIPSEWTASVQELPDRRKLNIWMDPKDPKSLVFIAFTPVRDDFTSLGSFGSVDQVAVQTILPKGQLAGVEVDSKMLSAVSAKQSYLFDYLQSVPNVQPMTHFRTIFTLQQGATGGAGSVLVTITAQTPEERYKNELESTFNKIIDSFTKS
mmetsp:Transcript_17187/g.47078  ORF Transcript_17187/g.47078 Transcript_17187/m.47078 type:complete len:223 (+) Transcript_17187:134-802(+)|eukprot:CAMPEP_0168739772 /NCGR_PEP_ID=MMETSP0724-20121128/11635_1 /TAXON_ID=265536 /ORGANISM="Amphiprora sp., Strain CCMP467" /LENGTH=222 /DNA_ID=CAMNT_0008787185 /DNA_START=78 /DNA_END=746 /DNA_ORIENTATION=+